MNALATESIGEVQSFRYQAQLVHQVVRLNVEGVTHEESLIQPEPGGNCLNWIVGHLVWAYAGALPLVRQAPMLDQSRLSQYARGGPPLSDPSQAVNFGRALGRVGRSDPQDGRRARRLSHRNPGSAGAAEPDRQSRTRPSDRSWPPSCSTRPTMRARPRSCGGSSGGPAQSSERAPRRQLHCQSRSGARLFRDAGSRSSR